MEGKKIYDESYEELSKIRRSLGSDSTIINWSKLDGNTKDELGKAVLNTAVKRQKEIQKVILGAQ